jgi:hypothetical protein
LLSCSQRIKRALARLTLLGALLYSIGSQQYLLLSLYVWAINLST